MKIPEGWPTEEMIVAGTLEIPKIIWSESALKVAERVFQAMLAAAPIPPEQDADPVLYQVCMVGENGQRGIWVEADKEQYDRFNQSAWEKRKLYASPQSDKLREAAEEVLNCFDSSARYSLGFERACESLRAALEGK